MVWVLNLILIWNSYRKRVISRMRKHIGTFLSVRVVHGIIPRSPLILKHCGVLVKFEWVFLIKAIGNILVGVELERILNIFRGEVGIDERRRHHSRVRQIRFIQVLLRLNLFGNKEVVSLKTRITIRSNQGNVVGRSGHNVRVSDGGSRLQIIRQSAVQKRLSLLALPVTKTLTLAALSVRRRLLICWLNFEG